MNSSRNMYSPLVSIIIVNWNGIRFLDSCLGSLSKVKYKNTEIFFVDNASKDDSVDYVEKHYPKIKLIKNSKNLGFAEGHDEAFKRSKGELILLLSTDTIVKENLLEELIKGIYSKKNIGVVMPKLLMYPKTNLIDSIGAFFLDNGMLYHFGREKDESNSLYSKSMEIYSAKGACILFRKKVLEKTGLFDKDYFAYFEETDLCHRIWLSGNSVVYWPGTSVCHAGGGTSRRMVKSFIQFHAFKNRVCTYIKNLSLENLVKVAGLTILCYQLIFVLYILTGKFALALAIQRSIIWNVWHLKETLRKRRYIQSKIRLVSDNDFLPRVTRKVRISYYYHLFNASLARYKD
jgi:GT2 family glycosyltransferase